MLETLKNQKGVEQDVLGLPVDHNIFSDHKGTYNQKIEKRQTKLLQKISFLKFFLKEDERILLVKTGGTLMSFFLLVFTNKRIFHIPTKTNYSYRNSISQILYADCQMIEMKWTTLVVRYKNGKKEKFCYIGWEEKIETLFKTISLEGAQSKTATRTHLCPRCTKELIEDEYTCPNCRLEFKSKAKAKIFSILFPGGGYFYTRHPWLGILNAFLESLLLICVVLTFFDALLGYRGFGAFVVISIILAIDKAISVGECNGFIKEYIPKEKKINLII